MIEVNSLCVEYFYGNKALNNISFSLENKDILGVIGDEEAGKTTLIKSICGLTKVSSGKIYVDKQDIIKFEKDIFQVIFSENSFYKYRSVYYNLSFPLKIRKTNKEIIKGNVNRSLDIFNLKFLANIPIYKLSTEEKILLMFARLLLRDPSIILIDNIFSKLSCSIRKDIFLKCMAILLPTKVPIVFCTDYVDEAITLANKLLILRYGYVEQYGYKNEIINNPATLYVDKLLNNDRTFKEIDKTNILFPKDSNYNVDKLFISYKLIETQDNLSDKVLGLNYYYCSNHYYVNTELGLIITNQLKPEYFVKIDGDNVRYYYYDSEKRFDHILIK